ncbi:unnamed protein product [Hermetia illucens]|uniref:Uncharacterized protein n=1 Tax=Hermetia illucens TaxID=343691 RepID=A0A7R8UCA5_HERIL|nr:unnamed protein product [Hermetia illucens]
MLKSKKGQHSNVSSDVRPIPHLNNLSVPTSPDIHVLEINSEDSVEEEEVNMLLTFCDPGFEEKGDQPHK